MEYIVSKASRERMEKLLAVPEVQMALRFLEEYLFWYSRYFLIIFSKALDKCTWQ